MSALSPALQSLWLGIGLDLACASSALPQQIPYTISPDGNREIYAMNVDGSNKTRLTNTPEDEWGRS